MAASIAAHLVPASQIDPILSRLPSHVPLAAAAPSPSSPPLTPLASALEILVLDRFTASLRPAFDHVFRDVLLPAFPRLAGLAAWREEVWLLLLLRVQSAALSSGPFLGGEGGSTAEEALQGWQRVPVAAWRPPKAPKTAGSTGVNVGEAGATLAGTAGTQSSPPSSSPRPPLPLRSVAVSLFAAAVLPYLRTRALAWAVRRRSQAAGRRRALALVVGRRNGDGNGDSDGDDEDGTGRPLRLPALHDPAARSEVASPSLSTLSSRASAAVTSALDAVAVALPWADAAIDLVALGYSAAYGAGLTRYGTPALHAARCELRRRAEAPRPPVADAGAGADGGGASGPPNPLRGGNPVSTFLTAADASIVLALIGLKLAQWWTEAGRAQGGAGGGGGGAGAGAGPGGRLGGKVWRVVPPPPPLREHEQQQQSQLQPRLQQVSAGAGEAGGAGPSSCPACGASPPVGPVASETGYVWCARCAAAKGAGAGAGEGQGGGERWVRLFEEEEEEEEDEGRS
jgi:hypothetical protein